MKVPEDFPFSKLAIPRDESLVWSAYNPCFCRSGWIYGIAITNRAVYVFRPFWLWLARWNLLPLSDITAATFKDSFWRPKLLIQLHDRTFTLRTPYDYQEEMDFDRRYLAEAAKIIEGWRSHA
jgi:hypothetical protein